MNEQWFEVTVIYKDCQTERYSLKMTRNRLMIWLDRKANEKNVRELRIQVQEMQNERQAD